MPFRQNLQCLLVSLAFMIDIGHSESEMFCQSEGRWIYFTDSDNIEKNITSPSYPNSTYSSSSYCDISIGITLPHTAVLQVEHRGIVSANCTTDYQFLVLNLGSLSTYRKCTQLHDGNTSQLIHVLLGNDVDSQFQIVIRLPLSMVERNRFHLTLYVVLQTTTMPKSSPTTTSSTTAVATSTRPTNITEFFEVRINVIAVAAGGGGGLILIIIIIVLCCAICRRNQTRRKAEEPHANAVELESRFPRLTSASQKNRSDTNIGNEYSSGELDVPVHHADVGDSTYSEVDIMPTSSQEADKRNHNGKSVEPPAIGKPGDRKFRSLDVYTPIDPKTKKEKVEMFDNDLYASRDSYNSDQSSGSENEE